MAPTVAQCDWKKHAEKPSGLGAFSGWIENIAILTSSADGTLIRSSFVAAEIQGEMACSTMAEGSNKWSETGFD